MRSFASEFPNDNPEIHAGTSWLSDEVCGDPEPHFSSAADEPALPMRLEDDPEDDGGDIEIVDELARLEPEDGSEHWLELVPPPLESGPMPLETLAQMASAIAREHERIAIAAEAQEAAEPTGPEQPKETNEEERKAPLISDVVPRGIIMPLAKTHPEEQEAPDVAMASDASPVASEAPCEPDAKDAYTALLRTMSLVATENGAPSSFETITAALEANDVARAWAAILRNESEDFSVCGAMPLDEWAASTLGTITAAISKTAAFRRDLRARGVAAFGLVQDAA